ncbi:SDR family oxidoreductase [Reyranella sp.]|uniref:SDR family oxidoreductase n=1 Tax=Reyranella sp. TaxID=1929291 RepID=UPI003F715B93
MVLVTGGNSGLGLASAKAFADEGAEVVISGRDRAKLDAAVAEIGTKAIGIVADVSRVPEIAALMREIESRKGRIDVLFANAGIARFASIDSVTEADWDGLMGTNLKGLYFTVQQALPLMRRGGSIVLNASLAASKGVPNASVYSASKAATRSLGRSLGAELVDRGIRVNVVSPGPIDTPIFETFATGADEVAATKRQWSSENPMKRFGTAGEVARAVLFLASAEASYITGIELAIDGGAASF